MAIFIMPTVSPMRTSTPIGNDRLVGRQNVQQLRLGLHRFDGEIHRGDALPGLAQIVQNDAEQAVQQFLLDLGDVALDGAGGFSGAAQQHFQNGKDQRRIQFQHAVAVVRA